MSENFSRRRNKYCEFGKSFCDAAIINSNSESFSRRRNKIFRIQNSFLDAAINISNSENFSRLVPPRRASVTGIRDRQQLSPIDRHRLNVAERLAGANAVP